MDQGNRPVQRHHLVLATLRFLALAGTVYAVSPSSVIRSEAAKPTTPTATITLNESNPRRGDLISFTLTGIPAHLPGRSVPLVRVLCFQGGMDNMVYQYSQWPDKGQDWNTWVPMFWLSGAGWPSGGANCLADLYYYTWTGLTQTDVTYLAHTDFYVSE